MPFITRPIPRQRLCPSHGTYVVVMHHDKMGFMTELRTCSDIWDTLVQKARTRRQLDHDVSSILGISHSPFSMSTLSE